MRSFLLVGLGGALGSMARYGVNLLINNRVQISFPLATFVVNLTGCFLIGFLFGWSQRFAWMQGSYLLFLATGFCGGFTTFSAFALENMSLAGKHNTTAIFYSLLSVAVGIALCRLGFILTKS